MTKRREFLKKAGAATAGAVAATTLSAPYVKAQSTIKWRLQTYAGAALAEHVIKPSIDAETKQILGASLLGIGCDEIVHSLVDMMYAKAPYTVIQRAMHIHPTVTELIPTMLGELEPLD